MKQIKNSNSKIEQILRRELWKRKLYYRKNVNKIFGKPDIVFIGKKIAVFCDSEFWHGYDWENKKSDFRSNKDFWIPKIEHNMSRDVEVTEILEKDGWTVIRFWGSEIKKNTIRCVDIIEEAVCKQNEKTKGN